MLRLSDALGLCVRACVWIGAALASEVGVAVVARMVAHVGVGVDARVGMAAGEGVGVRMRVGVEEGGHVGVEAGSVGAEAAGDSGKNLRVVPVGFLDLGGIGKTGSRSSPKQFARLVVWHQL